MNTRVRVEGLRELDQALKQLSRSAGKGAMTRAMKKAAQPLAVLAKAGAPELRNDLAESITASTKLAASQRGASRMAFGSSRDRVIVHVGAGQLPQAHMQEFGTVHHGPQPFMRPAWDQDKQALLERFKRHAWDEISKSIARAERRAARAAGN